MNAGFKVHKLSQIYKNLHNLNEANFNFFKAFKINSYKVDIFIFINSFNELKIYVKTKNKYVLLNEEDLIFLYINNYYLTWKKIGILNKNKIYIPFYASKNIFNLFYRFSIPYEKNEDISNNNVLLSYSDNKFSNNLYNNLDYNNIPFIVRFCSFYIITKLTTIFLIINIKKWKKLIKMYFY
ncbi:hypothetical protein NW070_00640 [Mycoplasmopsis cynos]|nr:hypothetical protein [Mycoplasmopsis cynos]UWV77473.1 hypothetical protein NW070_00640 [Mycoplasmopsis cynos]